LVPLKESSAPRKNPGGGLAGAVHTKPSNPCLGARLRMLHARQLIAARALAGWSQEDLAAAAGVSLSTVRGLEGGSRDTRFSSVLAVVEALRRRGVELAQSSERFMGGVLVVRGSASDWLQAWPEEGGHSPESAEDREDEGSSGGPDITGAASDGAPRTSPEDQAKASGQRRSRRMES
jgi:transcriptional regulator with XRE-family HTH domain